MSRQYNNNVLVVIDVDQTLICSQSSPVGQFEFYFNGSAKPNDPSLWVEVLTHLEEECSERGVKLIVQICSSKQHAKPDDTIDAIVHFLGERFFRVRKKNTGELDPVRNAIMPQHYYCVKHRKKAVIHEFLRNCFSDGEDLKHNEYTYQEQDYIPAIHLVDYLLTNKALVIDRIRNDFNVKPKNVFFIDNSMSHYKDLQSTNDDTRQFHFLYAGSLEMYQGVDVNRVAMRVVETKRILNELSARVLGTIKKDEPLTQYYNRCVRKHPSLFSKADSQIFVQGLQAFLSKL